MSRSRLRWLALRLFRELFATSAGCEGATATVIGVALSLACAGGGERASLALDPCRLEGLGVEARCGSYPVFEDRQARSGRVISLRVAVVPALAAAPRPDPLFVLVGGPGQAATEAGAKLARVLSAVRTRRDIVLVDQRGTGGSNPLRCEAEEAPPLERVFAPRPEPQKTRACLDALDADTRLYATPTAMDDLEEVRAALGYEQINLWGGSYGTRAALVYLRRQPERVRSMILDGAAPVELKLPLHVARDAQRALDLLYDDCAADAACQRAFPNARAELDALLARLEARPLEVEARDPRAFTPLSLRVERAGLASVLRHVLYAPELAALLPLAVKRASAGDFGPFIAAADLFTQAVEVSTGMFRSIVCAEDVPRIGPGEAEALTRGTFLGAEWLGEARAECELWPAARLPEAYFEPIVSSVPSLVLSGELDPVTPPSWGALVAERLSRSRHVVVPGAGHGASTLGCLPERLAEFLDDLAPAALDLSCLDQLARPPFFTSLQGPEP